MRLKKSFVALLVLLISVSSLAAIVRSLPVPSLIASTTATGVKVQGSGWTANAAVTLYYDVMDDSHKVCETTTDYSGSFTASFPLAGTTEGTHKVFAVQGATLTQVTFNVGSTSPPDDRLLNPILAIQNNLAAIGTNLAFYYNNLQTSLGTINTEVNSWFSNIDKNLQGNFSNIEGKQDNSATQMLYFHSDSVIVDGQPNNPLGKTVVISANKHAVFIFAVQVVFVDTPGDEVTFTLETVPTNVFLADFLPGGGRQQLKQFTVAGDAVAFNAVAADVPLNNVIVVYSVMVEGTPGTTVTLTEQ